MIRSEHTRWQRQLQWEEAWCFATVWTALGSSASQEGNDVEKNKRWQRKFQQKGDLSTQQKKKIIQEKE